MEPSKLGLSLLFHLYLLMAIILSSSFVQHFIHYVACKTLHMIFTDVFLFLPHRRKVQAALIPWREAMRSLDSCGSGCSGGLHRLILSPKQELRVDEVSNKQIKADNSDVILKRHNSFQALGLSTLILLKV